MAISPLAQTPAPAPSPTQQAQSMGQRAAEMEQSPQPLASLAVSTMQQVDEQRDKLNSAVERMISSLDRRKAMPFDPVLMSMAAGFLKPTKTGSFGESLGYASEAGMTAAEREFAQQQADAKLELELQQKLLESKQKKLGSEVLAGLAPSAPGFGAATIGAPRAPAGAPAGVPPGAGSPPMGVPPAGVAPGAGGPAQQVQEAILGMRPITLDLLNQVKNYVDADTYKFLTEAMKAQQGEREIQQKEAQPAKYSMEGLGEVSVTPDVYRRYQGVLREINRTGNLNLLPEFYAREGLGQREFTAGAPGEPPKMAAKMPLAPAEREVQQAGRVEFEKGEAAEAAKKASALVARGAEAHNTRLIVQDARSFAESNPRVFDLLQDPSLKNQLIKAASEQGAQLGQFGSFTIPLDVIARYKLQKEDIEALQMFQARAAELTVQNRKTARAPGEGATTESEGKLYNALGLLASDSSRVIKLKSEFLEKRADFDEEVANAYLTFRKTAGNTYNDFLMSQKLKDIKTKYEGIFKEMREANADLLRTAPKQGGAAGKSLTDRLREAREKQGAQ